MLRKLNNEIIKQLFNNRPLDEVLLALRLYYHKLYI